MRIADEYSRGAVFVLEGGYDLGALRLSVGAVIETMRSGLTAHRPEKYRRLGDAHPKVADAIESYGLECSHFGNAYKPCLTRALHQRYVIRNLGDYAAACKSFTWQDTDRFFSWHDTGCCNIAHEAIDRHAAHPETAERNCLTYADGSNSFRLRIGRCAICPTASPMC